MPMSPRLLRPRQTIHPEAADWANRVRTNGGSVSGTTLNAVDRFVKAIHAAGIRDRFYRLNLFAGNSDANLAAVRTPLFRGPSLTGTQYGNATDTNVNFVAGDYAENSGLNNTGNKRLLTGLPQSFANNKHVGAFAHARSTSQFRALVGAYDTTFAGGNTGRITLGSGAAGNIPRFGMSGPSPSSADVTFVSGTNYSSGDFLLGASASTGAGQLRLFLNGAIQGSGTARDNSFSQAQFAVFTVWNQETMSAVNAEEYVGRIGGYTIGLNLTDAQAATYSTIWDTFLRAMGRR